jgi:undecaprenyl-diphosphatase
VVTSEVAFQTEPVPVEERLADRLSRRHAQPGAAPSPMVRTLRRLGDYDRAAYGTVAALSTPLLDAPLRKLSELANHSKPWILLAGVHVLLGPREARRAAFAGLAAVAAASLVVNQPMKLAGARPRPDRDHLRVPQQRRVRMPSSTSFPSGHSASAAAFAVAVGDLVPVYRLPLRAAASMVAFSRVYTGVHYPSDVVVGATVGALVGRLASRTMGRGFVSD